MGSFDPTTQKGRTRVQRPPLSLRVVLSSVGTISITCAMALVMLTPAIQTHAAPLRIGDAHGYTSLAGVWRTFSPRPAHSSKQPPSPYSVIGGNGGGTCPSGTFLYTGSLAQYNCYGIIYDGSANGVWLRTGGSNTFGIAHFETHNLSIGSVETIIEMSSYGIRQSNSRYLYGAYFEIDNYPAQFVQVYEGRSSPNVSGVDGNELGVVTAYCEDEYGNEEQICPNWVKETL